VAAPRRGGGSLSAPSRDAIWTRLREAGLTDAGASAPQAEAPAPWFVRVMLGIAGWIGALFLLGFVGVGIAFIARNAPAQFIIGVLGCGAASALFHVRPKGDFTSQFGLAVSLAGQVLIAIALFEWVGKGYDSGAQQRMALAFFLEQAVLFALVPNFIHRVWSAFAGACAATLVFKTGTVALLMPAALTAACLAVWLLEFSFPRRGALLRAGGYGLTLAALQTLISPYLLFAGLFWHHPMGDERLVLWAGPAAQALVLAAAAIALLRREGVALDSGRGVGALGGALVLALVTFKAPGLAPAVGILVLGYANGNRLLAGLGVIGLLSYLSYYYYSLQATLLEKSALLAAAGVALLVARFALQRLWPQTEAADA